MADGTCSIDGCTQPAGTSRGWCNGHYLRWQRSGKLGTKPVNASPVERFWSKVEKTATCWLWQGSLQDGYGSIGITAAGKTTMVLAHRFSYELHVGSIPAGLTLDHLCRVRHCVRPDHLEPVTSSENTRRSPIQPTTINAEKTHCPQGHEYTGVNPKGSRICKVCIASASRRKKQREKEVNPMHRCVQPGCNNRVLEQSDPGGLCWRHR